MGCIMPNYNKTRIACYMGYVVQAIVNNLIPLLFIIFQDSYGITFEMLGRLILINFITQLVVDMLTVRYVDKIGHRRCVVLAHLFCFLGLLMLGILPAIMKNKYAGILASVVVYAVGGAIIEVLISPISDALPGDKKTASMSLLHSFYSWGQVGVILVTTLILAAIDYNHWYYIPAFWSIIPFYNMIRFMKVPLAPPIPVEEKTKVRELFSSKGFLVMLLVMTCGGASEMTMAQWASLFAEKGLGVNKAMGDILGPCLFGLLMGLGRTFYGVVGEKIKLKTALVCSGTLAMVCYLAVSLLHIPLISLLFCAICGFAVSIMWPGILSLSGKSFPKGGTTMFGILAVAGDLGCATGPWIVGIVSDLTVNKISLPSSFVFGVEGGLSFGLLVAAVFPLVITFGLGFSKKLAKK